MDDNTELDRFTPNFGIIDTDMKSRNVIGTGIYNLVADPETGALSQTDNSYLITAQTRRIFENSSLGDIKI